MATDPDVVVVGAGGDGPAVAWRLGQLGIDVLMLEAGPWHGHEEWPNPHEEPGDTKRSADPSKLSGDLLDEQFTRLEDDANNPATGYLRFGPADRSDGPWYRNVTQSGFVFQVAGVGGTTLHYLGNHPRAYPHAFREYDHWPIDYEELVPYYQFLEDWLPIEQAPKTAKEELYYQGAANAGYDHLDVKNVTSEGYRPQLNAITQPSPKLRGDYEGDFSYPEIEGSTLAGHEYQGAPTPKDAPVEEKARRSSNVGFVPQALETDHVTVRPNAFVTDVHTTGGPGRPEATGVTFRDTWSNDTHRVDADAVVLAAGCIETPRLWLNADLPANEWVGKGMTNHYFEYITGVFPESVLEQRLGQTTVDQHIGQNSAARFDKPGTGGFEVIGGGPGIASFGSYSFSDDGYAFMNDEIDDEPWDTRGRIVDTELKEKMSNYRQTLSFVTLTDDLPHKDNGVTLDPAVRDEHGPVANVEYNPHETAIERRDELARIGANILKAAGATHVHRAGWPPMMLHIQSTMRMGKVTDAAAEAKDVGRVFIGDHSVLANSLGGPNPVHTGQAVALRTAEKIAERYFDADVSSLGSN